MRVSRVERHPLSSEHLAHDDRVFCPAKPLLDALDATGIDGAARRVSIGSGPGNELSIVVRRGSDGTLMLGLSESLDEQSEPLRLLARQMVGEADTAVLLQVLCEAGAIQCRATSAGVLKTVVNEGELVSAIGPLDAARGRRFALSGSLAREVIRTRDIVAVDDFSGSLRPLMKVVPDLRIGPMLLAPLIAHDVILGVLVVTRDPEARAFTSDDAHRLRAIADYAALALWKAELLDEAQAADRAKSRFLAAVSHELRTPLTALAGYEELLVDQVIGPVSEPQLDVLERMRSVTQHLAAVIEELLAFSSLEEGRETIRATDFLAADLVRATAAVVEPLARQKKLAFTLSVPDVAIRMTSDVDKIRQILVNLAGNAVKFTDTGEVRLELSLRNGDVTFTVRDTGIGIARRDLDRLFKPFAQLDTTLTRRHGGTGLGLYIARGLAELLGGKIEVVSELKVGSAFTLVLPADE
ncbi:MAG TPA: HAMP domain-containing sensor histidine kinase [Gemmatimonadaceae bacterium]|jgi:signal transduction histidine kinase